jgi:hypothetical protein
LKDGADKPRKEQVKVIHRIYYPLDFSRDSCVL